MKSRTIRGIAKLSAAVLVGVALGVGGLAALAEPPRSGHAPDPPAQASAKQWMIDVTVRRGQVSVERARAVTLKQPAATARVMGRYALELYVGQELLDRVRFNVPLTGDGHTEKSERPKKPFAWPTFEDVSTRMRVQITDSPRATYAQLVDRASGETRRFQWPPAPDGRLIPAAPTVRPAATVDPDASAPLPRDASVPDGSPPGPPVPLDGGSGGPLDASLPDAGLNDASFGGGRRGR